VLSQAGKVTTEEQPRRERPRNSASRGMEVFAARGEQCDYRSKFQRAQFALLEGALEQSSVAEGFAN
jgi:hypothetical protein